MLLIKEKDRRIDEINEIQELCNKNKAPLVILGVGVYAVALEKYLRTNNFNGEIVYSVDDEYITETQIRDGVIPFSKYMNECKEVSPVLFGFYNYEIVKKRKEAYKSIVPFMYDFHLTVINDITVDWNVNFVKKNLEIFNETYDMLSDEKSKHVMQCYIDAAISGEFDILYQDCKNDITYFYGEILNHKIEELFDCGAYDGDSAHDYIQMFPDYKKIVEFEPDLANVDKIYKRVEREGIHDLHVVNKGVWSETTTLHFASEGKSSSCISDEGDSSIDVIKIDDMYDEFTRNSLIKMDIEGSELEALKGATKVISEISPALAVCVYHKKDDLITIPQFIKSLVQEGTYDYYLGYQGFDLAELVFFALPKDN